MTQFSSSAAHASRTFLGGLALVLFVWAGFAADAARAHMAARGVICGAAAPHCGWCYATLALAAGALATLAAATPRPALVARAARRPRRRPF